MTALPIRTLDANEASIPDDSIAALGRSLEGTLVRPGDGDYDEARAIWNAMIDRRPGLIVRCRSADDVVAALRFAREHDLLTAIRGGGHNIAGSATCDDGLVIDLSAMKEVVVDAAAKTARVGPGALLADFDAAAQAHGLATPLGINSTTGVAGLTLGGGFGWLSRKHGLTVDNLLEVEIVTVDGRKLRAAADENEDLFWAVRGGGGNFGVVTSFTLRLHEVGPELLAGLMVHPFADAPRLLREYRKIAAAAPDELTIWVVMRKAPPLPFLPEEWHGKDVLVFALCYAGDMEEGEKAVAPLRALGTPIADVVSPHGFAGWQQAFDPLLEPGARNYWKSHDFDDLDDDAAIDVLVDYAGRLPGPECEIFIAHLGGAVNRVARDATAYPHRDAEFVLNVHTRWREAGDDDRCVDWARDFFAATRPYATGGVYVNFMTEDEAGRVGDAVGENMARLRTVKKRYDPHNRLRCNHNIAPAA